MPNIGNMEIIVQDVDAKTFRLGISYNESVYDIKLKIYNVKALTPKLIRLRFQGRILNNEDLISNTNISNESIINMTLLLKSAMEIRVKSPDRSTVEIEALQDETVENIKKKISRLTGFSVKIMTLKFQGQVLNNGDRIKNTNIGDTSVIDMIVQPIPIRKIFGKLPDREKFAFEVRENETVEKIKRKISKITGLPTEEIRRLICEEHILYDDEIITNTNISDNSVIHVVTDIRDNMVIFITRWDRQWLSIRVSLAATVYDIKKEIQQRLGYTTENMELMYEGSILQNGRRIKSYDIEDEDRINLVNAMKGGGGMPQIRAKTMDGKTVTIELSKNDTVLDIKKKLQHEIGLAPDEMKLVFQGGILGDDRTADYYEINHESLINVVAKPRFVMEVSVKSLEGRIVSFKVVGNETVEYLKRRISEESGISVQSIKLLFQGEILSNSELIANINLLGKSVINMVTLQCNQISISIQWPMSKAKKFQVYKQDTIQELKGEIFQSTKIEILNQKLMFGLDILEDNRTLGDYEIQDGDVLNFTEESIGN